MFSKNATTGHHNSQTTDEQSFNGFDCFILTGLLMNVAVVLYVFVYWLLL